MYSHPDAFRSGSLPAQPTEALPGTEQKIRVMIERAGRREALFHPMDGLIAKVSAPAPAVSWWEREGIVANPAIARFLVPAILDSNEDFEEGDSIQSPMDRAG
jgi:hypothetical protein